MRGRRREEEVEERDCERERHPADGRLFTREHIRLDTLPRLPFGLLPLHPEHFLYYIFAGPPGMVP